jgi:50S ribosome-binding GTPase
MVHPDLAHLQLMAEIDLLADQLERWGADAPSWPPAIGIRRLVERLTSRTELLKTRLAAPLVVSTLGGTGTGKSTLVNAILGRELVASGRQRPTTLRPTLICREGFEPESVGINSADVEIVTVDLPILEDLILIDCPDPDTSESDQSKQSNLMRLRQILPHVDLLLVTTTQQKYRSARVSDELALAACGAHLVFVQTFADLDQDIREDWGGVLGKAYQESDRFFIDSISAFSRSRSGQLPEGDFSRLIKLLGDRLSGSASTRIREANYLDLLDAALAECQLQIESGVEKLVPLRDEIFSQRTRLSTLLAESVRDEMLHNRRSWEHRLTEKVVADWGLSPWSLVLRLYQGLGSLASGTMLLRARTLAQMALWGTISGANTLRKKSQSKRASSRLNRVVAGGWDDNDLREATLILDGYTTEAGLDRKDIKLDQVRVEADLAAESFVDRCCGQIETLLGRLARVHTGVGVRAVYEGLLGTMLVLLLWRLGKNYFWDSWISGTAPVFGLEFYISSLFWLVLFCGGLVWSFTGRLRRGLRQEINQLAENWSTPQPAEPIFAKLESQCDRIELYQEQLQSLRHRVADLQGRLGEFDRSVSRRKPSEAGSSEVGQS